MKMTKLRKAKANLVINIPWMREIKAPKVMRGMGAHREITTIGVDFRISEDIEGVEVAEIEVNRTNIITDLKIEIMITIGNGDRKIIQAIIAKVTEGVREMTVAAITTIEVIMVREEEIEEILKTGAAVEIYKLQKDLPPHLTLTNIVKFVTKRGICLMSVS